MEQIGLPENMDINYGTTGSSSDLEDALRTFRNFKYILPGTYHNYNTPVTKNDNPTVVQDVIQELKHGYPCLVCGSLFSYPDYMYIDHIWLVHGMLTLTPKVAIKIDSQTNQSPAISREKYYLQCNFGMDGLYDGYYLSDIFDINYSLSQTSQTDPIINVDPGEYIMISAITNIRPELLVHN